MTYLEEIAYLQYLILTCPLQYCFIAEDDSDRGDGFALVHPLMTLLTAFPCMPERLDGQLPSPHLHPIMGLKRLAIKGPLNLGSLWEDHAMKHCFTVLFDHLRLRMLHKLGNCECS